MLSIPREPMLGGGPAREREPLILPPKEPFQPLIPPPVDPLIPPPPGLGLGQPPPPGLGCAEPNQVQTHIPSPPSVRREAGSRPREMVLGGEQRGEMDLRQGRQETLAAGEYRQGREAFEELRLVGEGSRGHESRVGREMVIGELPKQQQQGVGRGGGEHHGEEQARPGKEVEAKGRIGDIKVSDNHFGHSHLIWQELMTVCQNSVCDPTSFLLASSKSSCQLLHFI